MTVVKRCDGLMLLKSVSAIGKDHALCEYFFDG